MAANVLYCVYGRSMVHSFVGSTSIFPDKVFCYLIPLSPTTMTKKTKPIRPALERTMLVHAIISFLNPASNTEFHKKISLSVVLHSRQERTT